MQTQFELPVKVTGNSLEEIDMALAQAAGARIMARMGGPKIEQLVKVTGGDANAVLGNSAPVAAPIESETKEKKARKPKEEKAAETKVEAAKVEEKPVEKVAETKVEIKAATKDQAVEAVGKVNQKFGKDSAAAGIEKVKEVLSRFGVPSVSKMDPKQYSSFIDYCNEVCA